MTNREAANAATSSAVALFAFAGGVMSFVPPWLDTTVASVPRCIFFGLVIAVSFVLHFVYLGITVRRLGRNVIGWVILAVLTFPIASIVGLVVFGWRQSEHSQARAG
jgi:quinol-cytochrome oxidoreductase complex cytochrome b subunit